ncbi:cytidylate kinase [Buchnera aphidicola (Nipponaphis monzeni)]|uniref:Cytidylate kinase n=1 Tax=Buchnera aphidicola (Nipponaphis monzeni) TaxID=2495405 RepID=A0A455TA99_9GAMM|nr:(d)CMP kinase [Buchnera aphidicola]BBI01253.1 cytidylate kinase [Buchnera aphidicola (Nipponaphis monzeni)]
MKKLAPVITIDGPSGVGKSLLSTSIAKRLNWFNLESGKIYRSLAFILLKYNIFFLKKNIIQTCNNIVTFFSKKHLELKILFCHQEISQKNLMDQKVINFASEIASIPFIRKIFFLKQRSLRIYPGIVTNGRDMGTIIFPDAILKIFLVGSLNIRTQRRLQELQNKGININFLTLQKEIQMRDERDISRKNSPLIPAKDAIIIDTTNMTFIEVLKQAMNYIYKIN